MATTTRPTDPETTIARTARAPLGRRLLRLVAGLATTVALMALAGVTYQAAASSIDDRSHPAPGVLVDVDGRRLHLLCTGSGNPTVILESGLGGFSHDWSHLQPDIAAKTRVCSYDRAGYGWSEDPESPMRSTEVADNLRQLLGNAGEEGPFVLVGHSIGGLHVRSFARQYPDEVAAIVLVDSSHENQASRLSMLDPLDAATLSGLRTCRRLSPFGLPRLLGVHGDTIADSLDLSTEVREAWISRLNQTRFCSTIIGELDAIEADIARPGPPTGLGDIPLTVLSSGTGASIEDGTDVDGVTDDDLAAATLVMADLQKELAGLSTNSVHHLVSDAGHYVHWDAPDVVASAIHHAVTSWRSSEPTDA